MNGENKIVEAFKSVQGEGKFIGTPSFFIRFAGCNLGEDACPYCDTRYAWCEGEYTVEEALEIAEAENINKISHIVITGGEPLMNMSDIKYLIDYFTDKGKHITIETNGTIPPTIVGTNVFYSISPKLHLNDDRIIEILKNTEFLNYENIQYKFLVRRAHVEEDVNRIFMLLDRKIIVNKTIILQPQTDFVDNSTADYLNHIADINKAVLELTEKRIYGVFNYNEIQILPQLHVLTSMR